MADTPSSKTQDRTSALFGLAHDGTYAHAAQVLDAAGLPGAGVPAGQTWRTVKALSDAELLAALPKPLAISTAVPTMSEQRAAERAEYAARRDDYREQRRTNEVLHARGYRWSKGPVAGSNPSPLMDDWDEAWSLFAPDGREITVDAALAEIGR